MAARRIALSKAEYVDNFLNEMASIIRHQSRCMLRDCAEIIFNCSVRGGTIYVAGNGGSAGTALHLSTDLAMGGRNGRAVRSVALAANSSLILAIGNDFGFSNVFRRQLEPVLTERDAVILLSVSGASRNLIEAALLARERSARIIGFVGRPSSELHAICDITVESCHDNYGIVEAAHSCLAHSVSCLVATLGLRDGGGDGLVNA